MFLSSNDILVDSLSGYPTIDTRVSVINVFSDNETTSSRHMQHSVLSELLLQETSGNVYRDLLYLVWYTNRSLPFPYAPRWTSARIVGCKAIFVISDVYCRRPGTDI